MHTHTHTHVLSLKIAVSGNVNQMNAQQVEVAQSIGVYIVCENWYIIWCQAHYNCVVG